MSGRARDAVVPGGRAHHPVVLSERAYLSVVPGGRASHPVVLSERSEPKDLVPAPASALAPPAFVGFVNTPIGRMMMRSDGCALTGLCLEDWWWAKDVDDSAVVDVDGRASSPVVPGERASHPVVLGGRAHHPVVLSERSEPKDPASAIAEGSSAPALMGLRSGRREPVPAHAGDDRGDVGAAQSGAAHVFDLTRRWLGEYFGCELDDDRDYEGGSDDGGSCQRRGTRCRNHPLGHQPDWTPPLAPGGTPFRREVWALVREIPWGETVSYGELAAELSAARGGRPMAAQAVGGAVKHNPITIIVPCHRVVGAGRAFGGYGGRLDVKAALLAHEGVDLRRFDGVPD